MLEINLQKLKNRFIKYEKIYRKLSRKNLSRQVNFHIIIDNKLILKSIGVL